MLAQEQLERNEIEKAQLRADADLGWELMRSMDAKHYEQGFMAAQIGMNADHAGLYSHAHLAGYAAAQRGATPQYVNVAGLPAMSRPAYVIAVLLLFFVSLFWMPRTANAQALPPSPAPCSSATQYGCYPHQLFAPLAANAIAWIDMPLAASSAETQRRYYVPHAPNMHQPIRHFGTIYGTVRCPDGEPAGRAIIYLKRADASIITSGTANGIGEYIISTAQIGTQGYLTWAGYTLTGLVTIEAQAQRIDLALPECTVGGGG